MVGVVVALLVLVVAVTYLAWEVRRLRLALAAPPVVRAEEDMQQGVPRAGSALGRVRARARRR